MVDLWPWILVIALGAFLALGWARAHNRVGRRNRARLKVAQRGERRAERLLERAGYRIVDRQVTKRWVLQVDGRDQEVWCRADLLLCRRGRDYVADVKTGDRAPNPTNPATRRQLMEYLYAFDVDGVLLVDMRSETIRKVDFPGF